jgi:hypothetical protein
MQIISLPLLKSFEFALLLQTEKTRVKRVPAMVISPIAEGETGVWMDLQVKGLA